MRSTYVPPYGNPDAKLALVGEQPGIQELRHRPPRPFVGLTGQLLEHYLSMIGILRRDCWTTNVIKDLDTALSNYIDIKRGGVSVSQDGRAYINELKDELIKLKPNAVVALGNIALYALTSRIGITNWRGSIIESTLIPGMKVIPTFHPATVIFPKSNFLNEPLIINDLKRAAEQSKFSELRLEERKVLTRPSFEQSCSWLNKMYEEGKRGATIDFDIEVVGGELDCFATCSNPNLSMSIPLRYSGGDYFSVEQELHIMKLLGSILEDENISKRGANFIFDCQFMLNKYGIKSNGELHCTQIAQKIAFPDYQGRLSFVVSLHTDIPYYKEDGKKWMKMGAGSWEEWWHYNGMDVLATGSASRSQMEDIKRQGNTTTYNRQRKLIPPLLYMSNKGIKIDVAGLQACREYEEKQLNALSEDLNELIGYSINYNSPTQLKDLFYSRLGYKPYKKRNQKGQWVDSVDEDALKRLSRNNVKPAQIMLDIRRLSKRVSTYLDITKVDNDGRYRSSYNPVGAETGRLSSSETIFGTGGNQQNWPHDLLRYFVFDDGYVGYSIDLSQIENRIVAYVGGISEMINAFEQGTDLHKLTAALIYGKSIDDVTESERSMGKRGNHSMNYDYGYKNFALRYELPEREAKWIVEQYHRAYPGVRQGYHAYVQHELITKKCLTNLYDRKRMFLGPIIPTQFIPASSCKQTYKEAYAHLPQSTTADKINNDGVNYVYYNEETFKHVELLTQVHDSIVFQIPLILPFQEHAKILTYIKRSLETPLKWKEREIHTPADVSIGMNMCSECQVTIKSKDFPNNLELLTKKLEEIHALLKQNAG